MENKDGKKLINRVRRMTKALTTGWKVLQVRETLYGHGLTVDFDNGLRLVLNWSPGSYSQNRDVNYGQDPAFTAEPTVVEACVRSAAAHGFATDRYFASCAVGGVVAAYVAVDDLPSVLRAIMNTTEEELERE